MCFQPVIVSYIERFNLKRYSSENYGVVFEIGKNWQDRTTCLFKNANIERFSASALNESQAIAKVYPTAVRWLGSNHHIPDLIVAIATL